MYKRFYELDKVRQIKENGVPEEIFVIHNKLNLGWA